MRVAALFASRRVNCTGGYREKGSENGKAYDLRARFTDTWVFENGEWRCVASHASLLTAKQTY